MLWAPCGQMGWEMWLSQGPTGCSAMGTREVGPEEEAPTLTQSPGTDPAAQLPTLTPRELDEQWTTKDGDHTPINHQTPQESHTDKGKVNAARRKSSLQGC
jgi:hypothetical protein